MRTKWVGKRRMREEIRGEIAKIKGRLRSSMEIEHNRRFSKYAHI